MNQQFVNNQTGPHGATFPVDKVLKSFPQFIKCPFCGEITPTVANRSCNICNVLCFICLPGCWFLCGICKEKDMNCYNANHSCMNCQKHVAQYNAC